MQPWPEDEFTERLRQVGQERYHDKHPFHRLMNEGRLDREQIQLWVANRFYYQKNIPIKDALLLARCPLREVRRVWVQRILDHDGYPPYLPLGKGGEGGGGGVEKWLRLGEAVGLERDDLEECRLLLPGVRFAVDAYVNFVATRPWIEGVASSLTELFAPALMTERLAAFEKHYTWIDPAALDYFRSRPPLAKRDSEHGLSLVLEHCRSREEQERAVAALSFKCDVLCAQLDALYYHCIAKFDWVTEEHAESDAKAQEFARRLLDAIEIVEEQHIRPASKYQLVVWSLEGMYWELGQAIPVVVRHRLKKLERSGREELRALLFDARFHLGLLEELEDRRDVEMCLRAAFFRLDPKSRYIHPGNFRSESFDWYWT